MISVLVPGTKTNLEQQLQHIIVGGTLPPFDPVVIDFIDAVSKVVLLDNAMRHMPEMAAVAHWMRKGHISELLAAFKERRADRLWLARGIAVHFAPSNVDSIFLYSWFLSMLVGNANIVRLSQRRGEQVGLLLEKINLIFEQERFNPVKQRNMVLAYEHEDEITEQLSQCCHVRVLWGGDESVRRLRAIPMNPLGKEVVFANRFSLAMIGAGAVACSSNNQLSQLIERFCNDSFWFDQMACSSPRLVVWVGEKSTCDLAKQLFWEKVQKEVVRRSVQYPEIIGVNKLVTAYVSAGLGLADQIEPNPTGMASRIHLVPGAGPQFRRLECGGGLFFETEISDLNSLPPLLTERDQTLSYFGFCQEDFRKIALFLPTRSVDRIVPIGSALNFSVVWDGSDLLQSFSREIDLQ
jgi:acyl-CoA reductase LuxC